MRVARAQQVSSWDRSGAWQNPPCRKPKATRDVLLGSAQAAFALADLAQSD